MSEQKNEMNAHDVIAELVQNAREAMEIIKDYTQEQANDLVKAAAWAIYQQSHAEQLAEISVRDTGLGKYEDKVSKNQRKTLGCLRDLMNPEAKTVGIINEDETKGLIEYAKPLGVIAAVCPSTNPGATPANKVMFSLKSLNAVILSPSPKGASSCEKYVEYVHEELKKIGAPLNLVQMVPAPVSKEKTKELMEQADFIALTGSANNIRMAQTSGTPNACVSAGNVVTIVDSSADLKDSAHKIMVSKTFDYGTSCSSDNALVIEESVYDEMIQALIDEGGYMCSSEEKEKLHNAMWDKETGKRRGATTCKAPDIIAKEAGLDNPDAQKAAFFMVEETGIGKEYRFSDEKLSVVLTIYKAKDFEDAMALTKKILRVRGRGHSCGLHTTNKEHVYAVGKEMEVCRIMINQSQAFGNGGNFNNCMSFTLSMGGGTWSGNNIKENLNYKHFFQVTKVASPIPEVIPTIDDFMEEYWEKYGK